MLRRLFLVGSLLLAPHLAAAAGEHLATPKLAKAAIACQKVIGQVGAKVLADKLKALDACANAALACVETKQDKPDCLAKAGATCAKQLEKAAQALAKSEAKIAGAKSCAAELRLPDLLSADGLGLGDLAGDCQTDFALDVCGGLDALAACLVRTRDQAAGAIFGEARPRTSELLTLPNVALPAVAGLPAFAGCGSCGAAPASRKAVEACGKALTKARQTLGASLEKTLAGCAQKVLACVQAKSDDPKCLPGAGAGCDKAAAKVDTALAKFAAGVAKKCGAAAVDFAELGADSGLGLAALATTCTNAPVDAAGVASCLQSRAQCATAALVRQTIGRAGDFAASGYLGGLAPDVTSTCPEPQTMVGARTATTPRFVFGGISKFLKSVRRTLGSNGSLVSGGRPASSLGAGRGIVRLTAPSRVTFGGVAKIQFRYKTGGALSRGARAADPPMMIVAVQRRDVALDDHFEVPLDPNPGAGEVEDEIAVTYQDTIPGCAFTLALATRIDGVVSDYTPVPQVIDTALPSPRVVTQIMDESGDGAGNTLNDALGLATDTFGGVYVTGAASNNVFRHADSGAVLEIIDATGDGTGHPLTFAYAASITGSDNVFVASHAAAPDTYVFRVSASGNSRVMALDSTGDGTHAFSAAGGIASDFDEAFYVTGALSDNAFKVPLSGPITQIIDATGDGTHALSEPSGIAVNKLTGDVYVAGKLSSNVFKIPLVGPITQIIDANGDGVHALGEVVDVDVDAANNVYVVGSATSNAFKITPGGTITQIIDASGAGGGGFAEPVGVATAGTDVYVLGGASSRRGFQIAAGGAITEIIGPTGDGVHPLELPGDIATDALGNVYVSDRANRVFKIAP